MTNSLSELEDKIYNTGERLIPGITHDIIELIRHRSTYVFFRKVIEHDVKNGLVSKPVRIADLGCGVGHGCHTLAEIPDSQIVGVDISSESLAYARLHYSKPNISYLFEDLQIYISKMPEFDYVVSRHAFEHISDGLNLAKSTKWCKRLLFEVPYDELAGNPHHLLRGIREEHFSEFSGAELFYQDLDGFVYNMVCKPQKPNGIICVMGNKLPTVFSSGMTFPLPPWRPEEREYIYFIEQFIKLHIEYCMLQQKHQQFQQEYQALQQTRAVVLVRKLAEHPFLMKLAEAVYSFLSKVYYWFGGR